MRIVIVINKSVNSMYIYFIYEINSLRSVLHPTSVILLNAANR